MEGEDKTENPGPSRREKREAIRNERREIRRARRSGDNVEQRVAAGKANIAAIKEAYKRGLPLGPDARYVHNIPGFNSYKSDIQKSSVTGLPFEPSRIEQVYFCKRKGEALSSKMCKVSDDWRPGNGEELCLDGINGGRHSERSDVPFGLVMKEMNRPYGALYSGTVIGRFNGETGFNGYTACYELLHGLDGRVGDLDTEVWRGSKPMGVQRFV